MIKQTLYFGNPGYLSLKDKQLVIRKKGGEDVITRPIEDIGIILLDHPQITITHNLIQALQANKCAIISCDEFHMPASLMMPMEGHTLQSEIYRYQIKASIPLKKNLWRQTVMAKIANQNKALDKINRSSKRLAYLLKKVQSGDPENIEGQAAARYWSILFDGFQRDRFGEPPNGLLNYGYAILRSMVARALVSSGLLVTLGIHHHNKYNAYCLADDIMEPYRPFVDLICYDIYANKKLESFLTVESKQQLLALPTVDAIFGKLKRPLLIGMAYTTASLADCFQGKKKKIVYPMIL